jgi:hypothetical protein
MKKVTFLGTALCVLSINYANALPIEGSSSGIFVNNVNGVVEQSRSRGSLKTILSAK